MALAMFHFSRMGIEYTQTTGNSFSGDLWADFGDGPKIIEVKATSRPQWAVRKTQNSRIDYYIFVNTIDTDCWLVESGRVDELLAKTATNSALVIGSKLGELGAKALHRGVCVISSPLSATTPQDKPKLRRLHRVKKRLASGEIKIYEYRRDTP